MRPLCPLPGGQGHKLGPLPLSCLGGRNCRLEPGPSHLLRLAPHLSGPQVPVHITGPLVPTSRLRRRQGSELMWVRAGVRVKTHLQHWSATRGAEFNSEGRSCAYVPTERSAGLCWEGSRRLGSAALGMLPGGDPLVTCVSGSSWPPWCSSLCSRGVGGGPDSPGGQESGN